MKIESIDVIPFPRDLVFRTLRDKLPELVPHLPNIENIEIEKREALEDDSKIRVMSRWKASSQEIPIVAKAIVTPDMLQWLDHATWIEEDWSCQWRLETNFLRDQNICSGRNTYTSIDDRQTELAIRGELTINAKSIDGVPKIMAGVVGKAIEKFVLSLITPNFKRLHQGLVQYLEAQ